jgi:hypothetical protein
MKKRQFVFACVLSGLVLGVCAIPASAAPVPVTYLNANFGPPNGSGFNFYRSSGTIQFQSATASVTAKARNSQVEFSAYADGDPNETSSGFSSYDIGTVNAGPGSLNTVSVTPRTLVLSGSAVFAMNLWFDSDDDGEYFDWDHNQLAGLGGDVYAQGPSGTGTLTIDQTTLMQIIPECSTGVFYATLATINAGLCTSIPPDTNVARWVGIDIGGGSTGSGSATL